MIVLDVLDGSVVQAGPREDSQGQGRREEIEFTIGEATDPASVSYVLFSPGTDHLLFAQAPPAPLPKRDEVPLERVVLPSIREQPALRDELLRLREQALVGVLDHGGHAHWGAPGYHPLDLPVLAPVDQVLVPCDPRGPVPEAWHEP